jgi:hypothetical protein
MFQPNSYLKEVKGFEDCSFTSLAIPDWVERIKHKAFHDNSRLRQLKLMPGLRLPASRRRFSPSSSII